ncbi:MAG: hypothetical protein A2X25_09290 [Chloroflexi bacterium GWB2_49_20]|nr:MAG: hypothetical protein A2X25_09290 [Chloroflexi bacterium GWB2_49_20]OGN79379.1 MAG: hypothetical protein A2X26_04735 [Chloroflexi bacterium GWC2_49_37]OGN82851.1 MAG: hypothetical protein A2X27_07960 [Chloroflexi bacterium GWD2_49_16]HCC78501.1 hypothetical protein [Anaerolineae bacterium]HCM97326.1 hypothetical protein [Anaerolineae bacterium]
MIIAPGSIIKGPRWLEPIKVDLVEDHGEYVRIVGATVNTRTHIDQMLPISELDQVMGGEIKPLFSARSVATFQLPARMGSKF